MRITASQLRRIIKEEVSKATRTLAEARVDRKPDFEYPGRGKTMNLGRFRLSFYKYKNQPEVWVNFDHPDHGSGNDPLSAFAELIDEDIQSYGESVRSQWEELSEEVLEMAEDMSDK